MSNTPVKNDRATWKTWALVWTALALIAFGIPAIAAIPNLGQALIVASLVAIAILAASRYIDPSRR